MKNDINTYIFLILRKITNSIEDQMILIGRNMYKIVFNINIV